MSEDELPSGSMHWPITDDAIRDAFALMLADGSWGRYHGPHCDALRMALAEYHGTEHVQLCASGTAATELALRAVPVESGHEVILSAYDFKSNFMNVHAVGATPVLFDTLPGVPVIAGHELQCAVTDRTKAIIVSHLHGSLTPMHEICDYARSRGIAIIEDACQCPGAIIDGQRAGSLGDLGLLSFGGSKLLTAGRGGAVLTKNPAMAQRIKLWTQRGNEAYPLSELQAAVILPQLLQLDSRNRNRLQAANEFLLTLDNLNGFPAGALIPALLPRIDLQSERLLPVFYKLALLLHPSVASRERDSVCRTGSDQGLPLDPAFPALHRIHSARRFRAIGDLPNATELHERLVVLHHSPALERLNYGRSSTS
jgi:perosamine synthetase